MTMLSQVRAIAGLMIRGALVTMLGFSATRAGGAEPSQLVAAGAKVEKLAEGFIFTEGPAADAKGNVYFTDVPNSKIHKWTTDGKVSLFRENTNGANGLYFDAKGNLLACEGRKFRVTATDMAGNVTIVADKYNAKEFNSPNDLWVDPKGGVYFTDPRFGSEENLSQDGQHVYYVSPDRKKVARATTDLKKPNGIIGTKDGKTLYVADHGGNVTYAYAIQADGTLADKKAFAPQGSDGVTLDERGNLYLTSDKITVYDKTGKKLEEIPVPQVPANVTFGGIDGKLLFITARTSIYGLKMNVKGQ
jgi:gluconolactonase